MTPRFAWLAVATATACGGDAAGLANPATEQGVEASSLAKAPTTTAASTDPFAGARSLRLERSTAVRARADIGSNRLGTIARDTRVGYRSVLSGPGCDAVWVEIEPRGWVCGAFVAANDRPARGVELPSLPRGRLVPGVYGKVLARGATTWSDVAGGDKRAARRALEGSVTVRRLGELEVDDTIYWRIGGNEYLDSKQIRLHRPSSWAGVRLGDASGRALPLGFALDPREPTRPVPVRAKPSGDEVGRLRPREAAAIIDTRVDDRGRASAYQLEGGGWVTASQLRVAEAVPPPPTTGPRERWVDIDLDRQLVVAYEGALPIYATMTSSGSPRHPSKTGIFRVWIKRAESDMNGQMGDEAPYSVSDVPWTQFYFKDLALHTSYWHDRFGEPRSHGCMNLAPVDARFLYFWTEPSVPRGWSMAHGSLERPGSMVRVRSSEDPSPEFQGYAKRVYQARLARQPALEQSIGR